MSVHFKNSHNSWFSLIKRRYIIIINIKCFSFDEFCIGFNINLILGNFQVNKFDSDIWKVRILNYIGLVKNVWKIGLNINMSI